MLVPGDLQRSAQAAHRRRVRGDPARFPPRVELGVLVLALVVIAGVNALRSAPSDASPAEATAAAPEATAPTTTTTTPRALSPLAAPPPAAPVELDGEGLLPVVHRVPTDERVVFVTIDDGVVHDPAALAYLDEQGIPFTTFLTMAFAEADPEFWWETQRIGGMIEGHTIGHADLTAGSEEQRLREICGTQGPFTEVFGRQPTLFRPPYGRWDDGVRSIAGSCGYHAVVMWSGTANDGRIDLMAGAGGLRPGDIILLHWRDDLLENLRVLVELVQAHDFEIGLLEEWLPPGE